MNNFSSKEMMKIINHFSITTAVIFAVLLTQTEAGEEEFNELQYKLEADVLEFRDAVERAYESRCNPSTLQSCHRSNYDACSSEFPNPVCPAGEDYFLDVCVEGCSSRYDYSISNVYFPPFPGSRDDPSVQEDICFSKSLDDFFVNKYEADRAYWEKYGIDNPSMYVGMTSGAFRIYPARANATCNDYDPRVRPWYVAGSSGPKNVVMLLDTSGSMEGIRLYYLKQAAIRIIDTLTVGDRVALVPFSTTAQTEYFDGKALVKVTALLKEELKRRIRELQAVGSTNIYDAFRRAFQVMEESIPLELVVDCNTAILFLTDGKMTDPPDVTEETVLAFVEEGLIELEERLSHPVHLFSYSISENDDVHTFPKQLACTTTSNGIWSKVIDERTIVDSLTSYSNLFSLGLGEGKNDDFTAWVEPYQFSTSGKFGVTVSAPVFDRTVDPAVLIGVVGMDQLVRALDRALGVETGSSETYDRIVLSSTAKCPRLETSACQMEAFRSFGIAGDEAICGISNCSSTEAISLTAAVCANQDDLPSNLLNNQDNEQLSFVERACCTATTTENSGGLSTLFPFDAHNDTCVALSLAKGENSTGGNSENLAAIIGGSVGGTVILLGILYGSYTYRSHKKKQSNHANEKESTTNKGVPMASATAVEEPAIGVVNLTVMSAPPSTSQASAPMADRC